jgi:hypothetical protein
MVSAIKSAIDSGNLLGEGLEEYQPLEIIKDHRQHGGSTANIQHGVCQGKPFRAGEAQPKSATDTGATATPTDTGAEPCMLCIEV